MIALGLSAHAPDAAAVLVRDGLPLAAAREELFTGVRRDASFPRRAVRACLRRSGVPADEIDAVVFFAKPLRKFERELTGLLRAFPSAARPFSRSMFDWLGERLWMRNEISSELGIAPDRILFAEHHRAHAAGAFLTSPFEEAAILTSGGSGEWATVALSRGAGAEVEVQREVQHPHSLERLVAAVMRFVALDPSADEGAMMALAGLGQPRYLDEMRSLLAIRADGAFELDRRIAGHDDEERDRRALAELFGPPRPAGEPLRIGGADRRDADLAHSLREVLLEAGLALLRALAERVPSRNLCLGGPLARDPYLNLRLLERGPFENLYADPAAGNAGAARGAALLAAGPRDAAERARGAAVDWLRLGPEADDDGSAADRSAGLDDAFVQQIVERLAGGRLVGWMRGPAEFSGRSTGTRALLADPRSPETAERIRQRVKRREPFVPFGALVPAEHAARWFDCPAGARLALGLGTVVARVREGMRASVPGVVHADGTVRVRSVERSDDPLLHEVLVRFGERAGVPVLLHTTLRLHGEPMARAAEAGRHILERSRLDCLVVERRFYDAP